MNENKSKYELDIKQIFDMLIKRWWIIVIAVVLLAGAAFGYTKLAATPTYTSSATLLINGDSNLSSYQQILAGQYQTKDYPFILKSLDTLDAAAALLNATEAVPGKEYSGASLSKMVSYKSEEDSRIFKITVTASDPDEARAVADKITAAFNEKVNQHTDNKVTVKVVEAPRKPGSASTTNTKRNVLIGAAIGLVLGAGVAILLGVSADTLDSDAWLHQKFADRAPLLASIPNSAVSGGKNYYRYKYKRYYRYSSKSDKTNKSN